MTNVNLARQDDDLATVRQTQESLVTEGPELTLVIPTLNERDNIGPLVDLLDEALDTVNWEVIFVDDDSPDGTVERIREISRHDRRVRCPAADWTPRAHDGLHRRRTGGVRTPYRHYGCRHAARREAAAADAGDAEKRTGGSGGW
jgi:hypothetical protein